MKVCGCHVATCSVFILAFYKNQHHMWPEVLKCDRKMLLLIFCPGSIPAFFFLMFLHAIRGEMYFCCSSEVICIHNILLLIETRYDESFIIGNENTVNHNLVTLKQKDAPLIIPIKWDLDTSLHFVFRV